VAEATRDPTAAGVAASSVAANPMSGPQVEATHADGAIVALERLAVAAELRLLRLERLFRWTMALLLLLVLMGLYLLLPVLGAQTAWAQRGWPHEVPERFPEPAALPEPVRGLDADGFNARIEALRGQLAEGTGPMDPLQALVVILQDLRVVAQQNQQLLAPIPALAGDIAALREHVAQAAGHLEAMEGRLAATPLLVEELRRLNVSIDIMTSSIDSTMGRMGRMMPYAW
jgi:hypothetical protein